MPYRDRFKDDRLRRVRAGDLIPDPRNWRLHPERQRKALDAMMRRLGSFGVLTCREGPRGELYLIDGHLRADMQADDMVRVAVVDLDEAEAGEAIASFDAITGLAETDTEALRLLLTESPDGDELAPLLFDDDTAALLTENETDWPAEPDKRTPLVEMKFIVSEAQHARIKRALAAAAKRGAMDDDPENQNTNGAVLAAWADAELGRGDSA